VQDQGQGQCEVKIIPQAAGNHKIDFRIKNQSIQNSPFNLMASHYRDPKSIPNEPTLTFGSHGLSNGQLYEPFGICVNSKNQIIVADCLNHRIQFFDQDGKFIRKFGAHGKETGQFYCPRGIATDRDDNIYIPDAWNNRIQIFNDDGLKHLQTFGSYGSNDGQFSYPSSICIDPDNGNIIITDSGNHRIQIFDKNGNFLRKFGKEGQNPGEMDCPYGIALNSKKEIIVSELINRRLQIFDYQGNHLKFMGQGELDNLRFLCLDEQELIYVTDEVEGSVKIFDSAADGKLIHKFGRGALQNPYGIAFDPISQKFLITGRKLQNISIF